MPLPHVLLLAMVSGLAASLAGRQELRMSPRPVVLTKSFLSYVSYACFVVVPVSVYFYVFHGDWFLLYQVDVDRIPSAVALIGFALEACFGALAFGLGAVLVRNQREVVVAVLGALLLVGGVALVVLYADRLAQVGDYSQFHGQYGLSSYESGPLLLGGLAMAAITLLSLVILLVRLWLSGRNR